MQKHWKLLKASFSVALTLTSSQAMEQETSLENLPEEPMKQSLILSLDRPSVSALASTNRSFNRIIGSLKLCPFAVISCPSAREVLSINQLSNIDQITIHGKTWKIAIGMGGEISERSVLSRVELLKIGRTKEDTTARMECNYIIGDYDAFTLSRDLTHSNFHIKPSTCKVSQEGIHATSHRRPELFQIIAEHAPDFQATDCYSMAASLPASLPENLKLVCEQVASDKLVSVEIPGAMFGMPSTIIWR